jgi:hypothetical protein
MSWFKGRLLNTNPRIRQEADDHMNALVKKMRS